MTLKLTESELTELTSLKMKFLLNSLGALMLIQDFSFERRKNIKKHFFRPSTEVEEIIVTSAKVWGFHAEKKCWGTIDDDRSVEWLAFSNIDKMRKRFLVVDEALFSLGHRGITVLRQEHNDIY